MLKYWLEYNDLQNVVHRVEIHDDAFSGTATEISGRAYYEMADIDNVLEVFRGSGLKIELDADTTLTFEDVYNEEQKSVKVFYFRDSVEKFVGWVNPEGYFEDFNNDKWVVSFDCLDGLSYLEDLSFVEDATGLQFTGKEKQLDIIRWALERTGLERNINTSIDIYYLGIINTVNVLDNVYISAGRYIKDDGDTIMSCKDVLYDILQPYGASIQMYNGEWYIFKLNQLALNTSITYWRYDWQGNALSPAQNTIDTTFTLGSQLDGFYPHYAGGNQSFTLKNSLAALRINYKYGAARSFLENTMFETDNGTSYDEFTILDNSNMTVPPAGGNGVSFTVTGSGAGVANIETTGINLTSNIDLSISIKFGYSVFPANLQSTFRVKITLDDSGTIYYLNTNNAWQTTDFTIVEFLQASSVYTLRFDTDTLPASGILKVIFYTPEEAQGGITSAIVNLSELTVENITGQLGLVKGENHTLQRTTKPSSKTKETIEVATGDNPADTYIGTIYKSDSISPTSEWYRNGTIETKSILQIMGEEHLRMSQSPARVFTGDIYGYFNPFSVITLDGFSGVYFPMSYYYDTKDNKVSIKLIQIYGGELVDIDYEVTLDYGNTVKPTIRG